jgi:hypothetical protein
MTTYVIGGVLYSAAQVAVARQIQDFCVSEMPWQPQQGDIANMFSIAAVANADRETSLNPKAVGDSDTAFNLWQWHTARRAAIKLKTGIDVWDQTAASALAAMKWEMGEGGTYHSAFLKITACTTPETASVAWCESYEIASAANAVSRSQSLATAWAIFFQGNA